MHCSLLFVKGALSYWKVNLLQPLRVFLLLVILVIASYSNSLASFLVLAGERMPTA